MAKVVTMGEIMLRLSTPGNEKFIQADEFDVCYGGGEANVAVSLANYGHDAEFVTKVPDNPIGECAVAALRKMNVKTDNIAKGGERLGIYFLESGASMRASNVVYDRAHSSISTAEAADFDFDKKTVRINKSYQRIKGEDVITDPKTIKSNRVVQMPDFLADEMVDYLSRQYELKPNNRIFTVTKSGMHHEMDRGCRETGVKRIRIHDLRHSHVSLLIEMGFSAVDIANRVGHESVKITYRYAHMFPSKDKAIADKLTDFRGGAFNE